MIKFDQWSDSFSVWPQWCALLLEQQSFLVWGLWGLGGVCFVGFLALMAAVTGRCANNIEYLGKLKGGCPRCREENRATGGGDLEIYNRLETRSYSRLGGRTTVETRVTMVKCMNCDYEKKLDKHRKEERSLQRRRQVSEAVAAEAASFSNSAYSNETSSSITVSREQELLQEIEMMEQQEEYDELRSKKKDRRGKLEEHPESARLAMEYGDCPRCCCYYLGDHHQGSSSRKKNTIQFRRWMNKHQQHSLLAPPIVLESLSFAECTSCCYIAKLQAHKRAITKQHAQQTIDYHDPLIIESVDDNIMNDTTTTTTASQEETKRLLEMP